LEDEGGGAEEAGAAAEGGGGDGQVFEEVEAGVFGKRLPDGG
jgi:hypothetical protein